MENLFRFCYLDEPSKVSVHTNEGYPGLLETLQINNNKQLLPVLTEEAMRKTFVYNHLNNIGGFSFLTYLSTSKFYS